MSNRLNVLILCERSGAIRESFAARGHVALSVDTLDTTTPTGRHESGGRSFHAVADARDYLPGGEHGDTHWDLVIARPPCTYLTNSGVRWLFEVDKDATANDPWVGNTLTERAVDRWSQLAEAIEFFNAIKGIDTEFLAIENPIPHKHAREGGPRHIGAKNLPSFDLPKGIGAPTQIVQPWQFGAPESKGTGWWLKGLPNLTETDNVYDHMMTLPRSERNRVHFASPGADRWMKRSLLVQGMADAIADQWGTTAQKES